MNFFNDVEHLHNGSRVDESKAWYRDNEQFIILGPPEIKSKKKQTTKLKFCCCCWNYSTISKNLMNSTHLSVRGHKRRFTTYGMLEKHLIQLTTIAHEHLLRCILIVSNCCSDFIYTGEKRSCDKMEGEKKELKWEIKRETKCDDSMLKIIIK